MGAKGQPKTGGRQKGSLNKKTTELFAICEEEGIDPFRAMLKAIHEMDEPKERFDACEKVCQYLYPKKRAVEVANPDGESMGFKIVVEDFQK